MKLNGTSPQQIKAARALLGWSQSRLAEKAGLSIAAVARLESDLADARVSTLEAILDALQNHGIEFLSERDGAFGVLRREPPG